MFKSCSVYFPSLSIVLQLPLFPLLIFECSLYSHYSGRSFLTRSNRLQPMSHTWSALETMSGTSPAQSRPYTLPASNLCLISVVKSHKVTAVYVQMLLSFLKNSSNGLSHTTARAFFSENFETHGFAGFKTKTLTSVPDWCVLLTICDPYIVLSFVGSGFITLIFVQTFTISPFVFSVGCLMGLILVASVVCLTSGGSLCQDLHWIRPGGYCCLVCNDVYSHYHGISGTI